MVISKTPFRMSFFGGGTDLPKWYKSNEGAVISTTIDKYCYVFTKRLPPFLDYNFRVVYSKQELVKEIQEIEHPAVRECIKFMRLHNEKLEVVHSGDLPARSGLGSSSAFTVGLLNALNALEGRRISKKDLANNAIFVEQEMIREAVGDQDQIAAAYGGFNHITFDKIGHKVSQIYPTAFLEEFNKHLLLFFTGYTRNAFEIEQKKIEAIEEKVDYYRRLNEITKEALVYFNNLSSFKSIGKLLHENWLIKKELYDKVSNRELDNIYQTAIDAGAIGGKLLGSGGGGFMLFFVEPEDQPKVIESLKKLLHVPFKFESNGSEVIYYNNSIMEKK